MIRIGMSTSCVAPLATATAFRLARAAGFDGIEVMVTHDPVTQDATALANLSHEHGLPVLSIHAPVLPLAQLVWGGSPLRKLTRSAELARELGATTVVVHPPFRWEALYARHFEASIRELSRTYEVEFAVENMFPLTFGKVGIRAYSPSSDPVFIDCDAITLDFSHAALGGRDSLEFAMAMGKRLRHVHLTDGTISMRDGQLLDEHLVPGRGTQPVAEVLQYLATRKWNGSIIAEVNTRAAGSEAGRLDMLIETREFAASQIAVGKRARKNRRSRVS